MWSRNSLGHAVWRRKKEREEQRPSWMIEFDVSWLRIFLGKQRFKRPRHDIMNEYYLARQIKTSTHLVSEFLWPLRSIVAIKNSKNLLPLFDSNRLVSGMQRTNFFFASPPRWLQKCLAWYFNVIDILESNLKFNIMQSLIIPKMRWAETNHDRVSGILRATACIGFRVKELLRKLVDQKNNWVTMAWHWHGPSMPSLPRRRWKDRKTCFSPFFEG